jgi:RNA polymerase sigma-70 factor, ECF subfamily
MIFYVLRQYLIKSVKQNKSSHNRPGNEVYSMDSDVRQLHEEMLRREVLAGSEQAWRVLYDETFDDLYRFVLWRTGNRRDWADEIVQETWLTAVRNIRRFAPKDGIFLGWMCGIAHNVMRNFMRRQKRLTQMHATSENNLATEGAAGSQQPAYENEEQIATVLMGLLERHEMVLRAKYFEGLSVAEIAANWNATPKTVESLLSRARRAFKNAYEKIAGKSEG